MDALMAIQRRWDLPGNPVELDIWFKTGQGVKEAAVLLDTPLQVGELLEALEKLVQKVKGEINAVD